MLASAAAAVPESGQESERAEAIAELSEFRQEIYGCLTARADELFELAEAVLCADGPVRTLVGLALTPEHRRGHGALYDAINHGRIEIGRLRRALATVPLPRAAGGRIVLAADITAWLRPDAPTSPERLFCHTYGRRKDDHQMIPGWPYSVIAALETGRTSWTTVLDAARLGPGDDEAAVTAIQLRDLVARLIQAGQWRQGDPAILLVVDAGYDVPRLAFLLDGLPVEVLGRLRSDRVLLRPAPSREEFLLASPGGGRPPKHGSNFRMKDETSWGEPQHVTSTATSRYGTAVAAVLGSIMSASSRSSRAPSSIYGSSTCPANAIPSRCGCGPRPSASPPPIWTGSGRPSSADSTWSTRSECGSRPWAGPSRRSATPMPPTAGRG
ncbi:transposase [Nonomuraea sp. NPDC049400]|uniref:transposase n=1 Tax=Nonomuraea sp. NPDC049400 TaxID=3364352 RepID=UPI00378CEE8B